MSEVTINIEPIEIIALKKLSLVSHALATKLPYGSREEQSTLAKVLDDVIRNIELAAALAEGKP